MPQKSRDKFAVEMRFKRRAKNWTQTDLGKRIGKSCSFIAHLENGYRRALPKVRKQLARVLGIADDEV